MGERERTMEREAFRHDLEALSNQIEERWGFEVYAEIGSTMQDYLTKKRGYTKSPATGSESGDKNSLSTYLAWHIAVGSTPLSDPIEFDLPGEDSIVVLLKRILENGNLE